MPFVGQDVELFLRVAMPFLWLLAMFTVAALIIDWLDVRRRRALRR